MTPKKPSKQPNVTATPGPALFSSLHDVLTAWASQISDELSAFVECGGELRDRISGSRHVALVTGRPFIWPSLPNDDARQMQVRLRRNFERFKATAETIVGQRAVTEAGDALVVDVIERGMTSYSTAATALRAAKESLGRILDFVAREDTGAVKHIIVPDTNALYWNSNLDQWRVGDVQFVVALTPPIVRELDEHQADGRNQRREKARKLVRQIGEYRRRGRLVEGVPLCRGVSTIIAIAPEPKMDQSLPWLDPGNNDDRFVASALELMRERPRAPVVIVTRDVNLQNKLEFARLPFAAPSDLIASDGKE
jgi:PIN domain